jgi:YgiT-type zinc finger domain-containing protein
LNHQSNLQLLQSICQIQNVGKIIGNLEGSVGLYKEYEMECPHCQGTLAPGKTSYTVNRTGYHLIIDDVPVLICQQCHEPLFTEEAVRLVQEMLQTLDAQRKELEQITIP